MIEGAWQFHRIEAIEPSPAGWRAKISAGWLVSIPAVSPVVPRVGDVLSLWSDGRSALVLRLCIGECLVYDVAEAWRLRDKGAWDAEMARLWGDSPAD